MQTVLDIIQYIVDLGSYVFVPILMCIIGLIFGLKPSKAIKAGVTVGIGLIGVSIVSTLTADSLSPVINEMVKVLNLNLTQSMSADHGGSCWLRKSAWGCADYRHSDYQYRSGRFKADQNSECRHLQLLVFCYNSRLCSAPYRKLLAGNPGRSHTCHSGTEGRRCHGTSHTGNYRY